MLVKRLLLAPLALLIVWMTASFFVVRQHVEEHQELQLVVGEIGEPDSLNPIISHSANAGDIEGMIFNALLTYDEKLNIIPDAAKSYKMTQESIGFCKSPAQAQAVADKLSAARDRWKTMQLESCHVQGSNLLLSFSDPNVQVVAGTSYENELFTIIDPNAFEPVLVMTIATDPDARFADGSKASSQSAMGVIRSLKVAGATLHETFPITTSVLHASVHGDTKAYRQALAKALAGTGMTPAGEIIEDFQQAMLNEPILAFKLRKDVRWHDGEPFTSHDVEFTCRATLDVQYRSPRQDDVWPMKQLLTPDEHTVIARYRYPLSICLEGWFRTIIPAHILEGKTAQWWADNYDSRPIGTGPYKIAQWKRNESVRLVPNGDYFEGAPANPAMTFRVLPDAFVNQAAFDARGFDVLKLAPFQVQRYRNDPNTFDLYKESDTGFLYIGWNFKKELFQDKRVRQAIAYAVDIDRITQSVYRGIATKCNGIYPPKMWYADHDLKPFPYDPDKARKMLAEAGWRDTDGDGWLDKNGKRFEFNLITNQGNPMREAIQALVQDDLKKVGIKVNTAVYEWAVFLKNYINIGQFDACVLGWQLTLTPDQYALWHSSQVPPGLNHIWYNSKEVDELLLRIRTTLDRKEMTKLAHQLQRKLYDDQPYLFLLNTPAYYAMYKGKFITRRPRGDGTWIIEPVRSTEPRFYVYMPWWTPRPLVPQAVP